MIKHIPLLFLSFFLLNSCIYEEKKQPNILLIMIDDLNDYNEDLNGHPQVITPNIKNFAKSAVSFKNARIKDICHKWQFTSYAVASLRDCLATNLFLFFTVI